MIWKYVILIVLVGLFFLVELIIGVYASSISLQSDAFHMLSDLIALIITMITHQVSKRKKSNNFTFGWSRSEIIGGLINSVFLLALCFSLFIESIHKFIELSISDFKNDELYNNINLVLIAAGVGLFINIIGMLMFHKEHSHFHHHHHHKEKITVDNKVVIIDVLDTEEDSFISADTEHTNEEQYVVNKIAVNYNNYALFLHLLGDMLGSILVIVSSLLIKYIDSKWKFLIDPIVGLLIIGILVYSSVKLIKACVLILLHQTPVFLDYDQIISQIGQIEGVDSIHDVHIWPLNNNINIASLHLKIKPNSRSTNDIMSEVKNILHLHNIHTSTIQPELTYESHESQNCIEPKCDNNESCIQL